MSLTSLQSALQTLEEGLDQAEATPANLLLRDGVIQRFEYSVDLCWKLLLRYLHHVAQVPESDIRTKRDIFREGARLGLLADPQAWFEYYDARNMTSHSYDSSVASGIYVLARPFSRDAHALLEALSHAT